VSHHHKKKKHENKPRYTSRDFASVVVFLAIGLYAIWWGYQGAKEIIQIVEMRQFTETWLEHAKPGDIVPAGLNAYPVWRNGNVVELIVWGGEPQPNMKGWHVYVIMVNGRVYIISYSQARIMERIAALERFAARIEKGI
jgi:hypothetical protein